MAGWSTTLNTNLKFAANARKSVENSRLHLDATKGKGRNKVSDDGVVGGMNEHQRAEVEKREDEFVAQTEEAEGVMKNVSNGCVGDCLFFG